MFLGQATTLSGVVERFLRFLSSNRVLGACSPIDLLTLGNFRSFRECSRSPGAVAIFPVTLSSLTERRLIFYFHSAKGCWYGHCIFRKMLVYYINVKCECLFSRLPSNWPTSVVQFSGGHTVPQVLLFYYLLYFIRGCSPWCTSMVCAWEEL